MRIWLHPETLSRKRRGSGRALTVRDANHRKESVSRSLALPTQRESGLELFFVGHSHACDGLITQLSLLTFEQAFTVGHPQHLLQLTEGDLTVAVDVDVFDKGLYLNKERVRDKESVGRSERVVKSEKVREKDG